MNKLSFALLAGLSACATPHAPPPEPVVRTVEVQVPVYRACPAADRLGAEPAYPDTAAALQAAPDLGVRVGLLLAGRVLRIARLSAYRAAVAACSTDGAHP